MIQEVISTSISYESRAEYDFSSLMNLESCENPLLNVSNRFGLCLIVQSSTLVIYNSAALESAFGESDPAATIYKDKHEVHFEKSIRGVYLSPSELFCCVVLSDSVVLISLATLFHEVNTFLLLLLVYFLMLHLKQNLIIYIYIYIIEGKQQFRYDETS